MITSLNAFTTAIREIRRVVNVDAVFPDQVFVAAPRHLFLLEFDVFWSDEFFTLATAFASACKDSTIFVVVLRPDGIAYYYNHFHKLPLLRLNVRDGADSFINMINEDPGGSLADAIVHSAENVVIHSESLSWVAYGDRSNGIAVLAAADEATALSIRTYTAAGLLYEGHDDIGQLLKRIYRERLSSDFITRVLDNYGGAR